ncbi:MAG TPA: extracellular solute-binding protein [Mycobacteriales bacterium]|nr:extracellular solute-binding protein [Mycobacteriales bacterium]
MSAATRSRRTVVLLLAAALSVAAAAACSKSDSGDSAAGGKVTITVNGRPPATQAFERKVFDQDVKDFEASHPDIHIDAKEGFMDPKTFAAKLGSGRLEDVYYVYFTDPAQLIARRQAADITDYVKDVPHLSALQPALLDIFKDGNGRLYGLPTANYSMGLLYSRTLFTRAGLNPDQPPSTWDEVRTAAKKIAALGNGTVGYADFSKNNQGGWHLTAELFSVGAEVASKDGDKWKAAFNTAETRQMLQTLHDMRWTDNSMGTKQLLEIPDVQRMMGAGKLGMYVAAPDNVPTLVKQFQGKYDTYGLAPMPGGKGTLIGGEGYMINPKASPAKIKAGLTWLQWKFLNPDRTELNIKRFLDSDLPIGLATPPTPDIWTGAEQTATETLKNKYANIPVKNYEPFLTGSKNLTGRLEPPNAQEIYAALDSVMQGVLTNSGANPDQLLSTAEKKVNSALLAVK